MIETLKTKLNFIYESCYPFIFIPIMFIVVITGAALLAKIGSDQNTKDLEIFCKSNPPNGFTFLNSIYYQQGSFSSKSICEFVNTNSSRFYEVVEDKNHVKYLIPISFEGEDR